MKKFLSSICIVFLSVGAFAQYGINYQKPFSSTPATVSSSTSAAVALDGTKMYAYNFYNYYFSSLDLPDYDNLTAVNYSTNYVGGVDFDSNGIMYCISSASNTLYTEDFETGTATSLGSVSGLPTSYNVGLAFDNGTGKLYCLQVYWSDVASLYSIDISTMTATLIGTLSGMPYSEALAFNTEDGMLYGFNFQSAQTQLYKINPSTAATTLVGTTTSFLNYTYGWFGDCDFNDLTGELIYTTYDYSSSTATVWSIDASNCSATAKATVSNAQLVLAVNTTSQPVPLKWYYFILVFIIPVGIIVWKKLF